MATNILMNSDQKEKLINKGNKKQIYFLKKIKV